MLLLICGHASDKILAEGLGFEPRIGFPLWQFSRLLISAAHPPFAVFLLYYLKNFLTIHLSQKYLIGRGNKSSKLKGSGISLGVLPYALSNVSRRDIPMLLIIYLEITLA